MEPCACPSGRAGGGCCWGQTLPCACSANSRLCGVSSDGPGRQSLTGPVREAILIKFGSIITGFVLWSYYGFFNLVNLSSQLPNHTPPPLLPSTTTGCGLRRMPGFFSGSQSAFSRGPTGPEAGGAEGRPGGQEWEVASSLLVPHPVLGCLRDTEGTQLG